MYGESVRSTFLLGNNIDSLLFKSAIHYAEFGLNVWFISPEPFENIPENISPPTKVILQLITFVYLKDYKDLLKHLNGIHLWHKSPNVIILSKFEVYSKMYSEKYNSSTAALISTSLLDSASVCVKKGQRDFYMLIAATPPIEKHVKRIKILHDLYFPHVIGTGETNEDTILERIMNYCQC